MSLKRNFWRVMTRIHKWAGLVLGVQIILWFGSGLFMTVFDIDTVHGDLVALRKTFPVSAERVIPVDEVVGHYEDGKLQSAKLRAVIDTPVWELSGGAGEVYVNAQTGNLWSGISAEQARDVASTYYIGSGKIEELTRLDLAPMEYRGAVPVWQLKYDDKERTRLYISPYTGDLLKTRTKLWRAFDFMWMLHIMDYDERDDINNWLLILASLAAFLFSLTGAALIVHRIFLRPKPHDFHT